MLNDLLEVLIDATLRGGLEVTAVRRSGLTHVAYKDAKELVTIADQRSDAAIRAVLDQHLPKGMALALEESGRPDDLGSAWVGADPLDGTNHFACGGTSYSVQAHFVEGGVPKVGVVFQPEVYLPLAEDDCCVGRIAYAVQGQGAFVERTVLRDGRFERTHRRALVRHPVPQTRTYVACVPISTKMKDEERSRAARVMESGLVSVTTGVGGAGGNSMLVIMGGQHIYANLGAGEDLDLIPPQVIAEEAGLTVWGVDRKAPRWFERKQPFVLAVEQSIAERFLEAAGL